MNKLYIKLEFKLQDCWIGVYWRTSTIGTFPDFFRGTIDLMCRDIWICLLPCLPLHISYTWQDRERPAKREQALKDITQLSQDLGLYE